MIKPFHRFVLLLSLVLLSGLVVYLLPPSQFFIENLTILSKSQAFIGVYLLIYTLSGLLTIPATILNLGGGALWGFPQGTLLALCGAYAGAAFGYLCAKMLGKDYIYYIIKKTKRETLFPRIQKNQFLFFSILRLIPIVPFNITNVLGGISGIPFSEYFVSSCITLPFSVFVHTYFAHSLMSFAIQRFSLQNFLISVLLLLIFIIITAYGRKIFERKWQRI